MKVEPFIKPGYFSENVAADSRRGEFDCKNQVLVQNGIPVDYVFIGDSITQMWELEAYFNRPNQRVINRGIGGDITKYVLKRFVADVIQLKPKHCIMKIGINDAWDLEFNPWRQEEGLSMTEVLQNAVKNIIEIVKLAKDNYVNLVLCSVLPTDMLWTNHENERKMYVKNFNEILKAICEEQNLVYVDYHSQMVKEDGVTVLDDITIEGLHPNVFGYNIMAQVLRDTLGKYDIEI